MNGIIGRSLRSTVPLDHEVGSAVALFGSAMPAALKPAEEQLRASPDQPTLTCYVQADAGSADTWGLRASLPDNSQRVPADELITRSFLSVIASGAHRIPSCALNAVATGLVPAGRLISGMRCMGESDR